MYKGAQTMNKARSRMLCLCGYREASEHDMWPCLCEVWSHTVVRSQGLTDGTAHWAVTGVSALHMSEAMRINLECDLKETFYSAVPHSHV